MDYDELINYASLDGLNQTVGYMVMIHVIVYHGFDDKTCDPYYIWGKY